MIATTFDIACSFRGLETAFRGSHGYYERAARAGLVRGFPNIAVLPDRPPNGQQAPLQPLLVARFRSCGVSTKCRPRLALRHRSAEPPRFPQVRLAFPVCPHPRHRFCFLMRSWITQPQTPKLKHPKTQTPQNSNTTGHCTRRRRHRIGPPAAQAESSTNSATPKNSA